MKYFASVDGRAVEVELEERHGELIVRVDGEPYDVDYHEVDRLGQLALQVGDRQYAASIDGGGNACWVTIAGLRYSVEIEDERERAASAAQRARGGGGGTVKSVMPGVVVEVLVKPGDSVEEGQSLLVLEAMKMQNEIAAPAAGVVELVHVEPGAAVGSGAKLVDIAVPPSADEA